MKQKSTLKKITGSREFLLAVILILLFAIITKNDKNDKDGEE